MIPLMIVLTFDFKTIWKHSMDVKIYAKKGMLYQQQGHQYPFDFRDTSIIQTDYLTVSLMKI
jgi:hypothetical protein